MQQGTEEWRNARIGKVTASRVADIVAKTKTGYSTSRANYMSELICERLTGNATDTYKSPAMMHGTETEPLARTTYEIYSGNMVTEIGLVPHPEIINAAASPDGLIDDDGLLEIKCPNTATHIETLLGKSVPSRYITQIHWQMACTGRKWCDFVSFDNRMPSHLQLFVRRVERNEALVEELEKEVRKFLNELDEKVEALSEI